MKRLFMLLLILIAVPCIATAAEVKNVKVSQVGNNAVATYDLVGGAGEQEAEVTVAITIGNEKRASDKLSLTGDFGKGVKVGTGKKIVWNVLKDYPSGPEGDLSWEVKVVNSQAHNILVLVCRSNDTFERCNEEMKCKTIPVPPSLVTLVFTVNFSASTVDGIPAKIADQEISWLPLASISDSITSYSINRYTKEFKLVYPHSDVNTTNTFKGTCEPQQEKAF